MPPTGWSWLPSLWSFGTSFRVGRGPCCLCSSVCTEEICCTRYKSCPARPLYFAYGRLGKKLLLDKGIELGLSTLLIALLKASIVLAHCVIFYTSSDSELMVTTWAPEDCQHWSEETSDNRTRRRWLLSPVKKSKFMTGKKMHLAFLSKIWGQRRQDGEKLLELLRACAHAPTATEGVPAQVH